jgi:hypothetical protein
LNKLGLCLFAAGVLTLAAFLCAISAGQTKKEQHPKGYQGLFLFVLQGYANKSLKMI